METIEYKCEKILSWAKSNPEFKTELVESILGQKTGGKPLSNKQEDAINNIYDKCVRGNSTRSKEDVKFCEELLDWAQTNDWFDPSFVESMHDRLSEGKSLSEKQSTAITRLWFKFIDGRSS